MGMKKNAPTPLRVYLCVHVTHRHTCAYTHTFVNPNTYKYLNIHRYICIDIYIYVYVYGYICVNMKTFVQIHIHTYICIHMYTYVYIYMHKELRWQVPRLPYGAQVKAVRPPPVRRRTLPPHPHPARLHPRTSPLSRQFTRSVVTPNLFT